MPSAFRYSLFRICGGPLVAIVLAATPVAAQQPKRAVVCFRLLFTRDSLTAFLPHRIEWDRSSLSVRMLWDTLTSDASAFRRLTAGRARSLRWPGDSVTVLLLETLTEEQVALRFLVVRDTLRGFLMLDSGQLDRNRTLPVVGTATTCSGHAGAR